MRLSYLLFSSINTEKIIKNANFSPCRNCIFYKPRTFQHFTGGLSKCTKFGEKDVVTGEITYQYVSSCRTDEEKCGTEGKYFVEEKQPKLNIKIFLHNMLNTGWGVIIITNCIIICKTLFF